MHEIPGITPPMLDFAGRVSNAGFTVWMPNLFGVAGKPYSELYADEELARACVSREFAALESNQSSPIADMLRLLGRKLLDETKGKGIGAIGMCITGNFALALMMDEFVVAPVLSQPALPIPAFTKGRKEALHISDEQLAIVKNRAAAGISVLGFRFTEDSICPRERFDRLRRELGSGFEAFEIDSSPNNPFHFKQSAHSVLVMEFHDEAGNPTRQATDRLIMFLRERLMLEE
jgi:dienelactone hydrolase